MKKAMDIVNIARRVYRPLSSEFINNMFQNFIEFHGDRNFKDDKSIIGGIAFFDKIPVTVIGIEKGRSIDENIYRNFGSPNPEGYRKSLRLMKQAEKFERPIITFINTSGAFCGIGAEERGQGEAIAKNLLEMSTLKVPIISIIIGEGGSGGALALAIANKVWMLENSIYSILSPEGFASILWKDSTRIKEAADLMKLTSKDLLKMNIIDKIIPEVEDGCDRNFEFTAKILKKELKKELNNLLKLSKDELVEQRYNKFRNIGEFEEI